MINMKKSLSFLIFLISLTSVPAQSKKEYDAYYAQIMQIESEIANERFEVALQSYWELFQSYPYVFASDAFNASQLAAMGNDAHAFDYVLQCGKSGADKDKLLRNYYLKKLYAQDSVAFNLYYNKGFKEYMKRVDYSLRKEFKERYELEQKNKGKSNYAEICNANFNRILELTRACRFPGEQLIGVNEEMENAFVLATLKHYPYSYHILETYLNKAVRYGEIQPGPVLYVYGFNQTRSSVLYTEAIPMDTVNFPICYNLPFGKSSADIPEVDAQRKRKYLSSIEVHNQMQLVAKKYRLDLKEGY